jgi:hypothetical protein
MKIFKSNIWAFCIFIYLGGIGVLTQGLTFAKKVPFHLSHTPVFLHLVIFEVRSCVLPGPALDLSSPIYTYYVSENTGTCHLTQLVG